MRSFRALAFVPARALFLLLAQALVALLFYFQNAANPWRNSTAWWTVYGSLADAGCLATLVILLRREGLGLRSLFLDGAQERWSKTVMRGFGYFLLVMPIFLGGFALSSLAVYGSFRPAVDGVLLGARQLPLWAKVYSVTVWWFLWSATEEMGYQGYLLPRLREWFGSKYVAMVVVGFWWALQHSALPFLPDAKYLAWRFFSFVPGVAMLMFLYVRDGRLASLIVAHWMMDVAASATTIDWTH